MSDNPTPPRGVQRVLDEEAPLPAKEDLAPLYRVDPTSKIAVSKHYGKLWDGRIKQAVAARKYHADAWEEAVRYYNNAQQDHRNTEDGRSGNRYFGKRRNTQWSETENVVYANTSAIVPALYTKNPVVEITARNAAIQPQVQTLETLVNMLAGIEHAPGLHLKVHAKQWILSAELCNLGWMEYGYTERADSLGAVQAALAQLGKELEDAKDAKTIKEIEGRLMALEEQAAVASPSGPWVRFHPPQRVICGPTTLPDFSDAPWRAIEEFYPTSYLNAKYGKKNEAGKVYSLYEPTHVLCAEVGDGLDNTDANFKLFDTNVEAKQYGYETKEQLRKAEFTKCFRIWDKTTRRVYLYASNDMTWPIWVEADPYGLPDFYPQRALYFTIQPMGSHAHSNVSYYLDQQDALNEIHDEFRRARQDIKENILYDQRLGRDTVEKFLKGSSPNAQAVDVPENQKIGDLIYNKPNALLKAQPLFDVARPLQSIDRISGVSEVLRGAQFKTNTTNKAVESYQTSTTLRLDAKSDEIEDAIASVLYGVAFLCAQFMTAEEVASIIGQEAAGWENHPSSVLRSALRVQVAGGSTTKPTSEAKKQQAMDVARILSQFVQFAPGVVIETTLKLFEESFNELTLPKETFSRIREEAAVALRRGNSDAGPAGGGPAGGEGAPPSGGPVPTGGPPGGDAAAQLAQAIDALPPEAKLALGQALARGAPVVEAVPMILRAAQQQQQQ